MRVEIAGFWEMLSMTANRFFFAVPRGPSQVRLFVFLIARIKMKQVEFKPRGRRCRFRPREKREERTRAIVSAVQQREIVACHAPPFATVAL
jgi:hypothetical protein